MLYKVYAQAFIMDIESTIRGEETLLDHEDADPAMSADNLNSNGIGI